MELAKEAEEAISKAATNILHVSIQLRLGSPIPQFNHDLEDREGRQAANCDTWIFHVPFDLSVVIRFYSGHYNM